MPRHTIWTMKSGPDARLWRLDFYSDTNGYCILKPFPKGQKGAKMIIHESTLKVWYSQVGGSRLGFLHHLHKDKPFFLRSGAQSL